MPGAWGWGSRCHMGLPGPAAAAHSSWSFQGDQPKVDEMSDRQGHAARSAVGRQWLNGRHVPLRFETCRASGQL